MVIKLSLVAPEVFYCAMMLKMQIRLGVAFALKMGKAQMKRTITCVAGSAAGMLEMQEQGSEVKPYNLGRAAMDGVTAAYMGLTDFEVPDDMLGGERGFFRIFSDAFDKEKLMEQTDYFEIERIYVKPYVSCRHSHSAVEAAIKLHKGLDIDKIDAIEVRTYKFGVKGHDHKIVQGVASAKLSTPYHCVKMCQNMLTCLSIRKSHLARMHKLVVVCNREREQEL